MTPDEWANALDHFWSSTDEPKVVLHIERALLPDVAALAGYEFETGEAEQDFLNSIRTFQEYKYRPWSSNEFVDGKTPEFLLLIAAQVYAASRMANSDDGAFTHSAYYVQLQMVVGREPRGGNFSHELSGDQDALWRKYLKKWAKARGIMLSIPPDSQGAGRHVKLPKSQAVLRVEDLRQLPLFFRACGLRSKDHTAVSRIRRSIVRFSHDNDVFPNKWARNVLDDSTKLPLAIQQICNVLNSWDGRWEIPHAGRRKTKTGQALIRWWVGLNRKKAKLVFKCGNNLDDAKSKSSQLFSSYLTLEQSSDDFVSLCDEIFLARYDTDCLAFEQVESFEPGDYGMLAVSRNRTRALRRFDTLLKSTKVVSKIEYFELSNPNAVSDVIDIQNLPCNCSIAVFQIADPLPSREWVDETWHQFLRWSTPKLVPSGGLRFGQKNHWIVGAGPILKIHGQNLPSKIVINDEEYPVSCRIFRNQVLSTAGSHVVHARIDNSSISITIKVSEPTQNPVPPEFSGSWNLSSTSKNWPVWSQEKSATVRSLVGIRFVDASPNFNPKNANREVIRMLVTGHIAAMPNVQSNHPIATMIQRQLLQNKR